jgi:hypothetical protein
MAWRIIVLVALLGALTACGNQSPAGDQAREIETLLSWTATGQLAADSWRQGKVPQIYTTRTLQYAAEQLDSEQTAVAKLPPIAGNTPLSERLQQVRTAIAEMRTAVEQDDRAALAAPLQQITTEETAFQQLLSSLEGGE